MPEFKPGSRNQKIYVVNVLTIDVSQGSPSAGFATWAGVIVLALGGFLFLKGRKE